MNRPYVIVSTAISLDGFIDDTQKERLVLSNEKDLERVKNLRDTCDAILVGANTIRKDNPKLLPKTEKRLTKITITTSGNIDLSSNFFTIGDSEKIVYTIASNVERLTEKFGSTAKVVSGGNKEIDLQTVLHSLYEQGIKRLLVEGGSTVLTDFFQKGFVDEMHLAVAGFFVGDKYAPKFVKPGSFPWNEKNRLHLQSIEKLDEVAVLVYITNYNSDKAFLEETFAIAEKCIPIPTAFCVGAIIVDKNGQVLTTGYSRETGPHKHAEEVAIEKALKEKISLVGTTLYSSLEPCGERLSGRKTCTERIKQAGIKRVVFGIYEPSKFVVGKGAELLQKAGIDTVFIETGKSDSLQ